MERKCKAFPKGIPEEIFDKGKTHYKPVKGQEGEFFLRKQKIIMAL
jgi:hypothetical protein